MPSQIEYKIPDQKGYAFIQKIDKEERDSDRRE
jgi:hypothetical protein